MYLQGSNFKIKQMKPFTYLFVTLIALQLTSCSSKRNVQLTFQVEADAAEDIESMTLRGVGPLIGKDNGLEMEKNGDFYTVSLIVPDSLIGLRFLYSFYRNGEERENLGFPPRQALFPAKSTTLPLAKFDDQIGSTGELISKSGEIPVIYANTPEEIEVLAEAFVGITTDGSPIKDIFPIKATGVSTSAMVQAAENYLAALTPDQKKKSMFPVGDDEWRKWHNIEIYERQGLVLEEMNKEQKNLAFEILNQSLSKNGLKKAKDIMTMEDYLSLMALEKGYANEEVASRFGAEKYYFTFMGSPSETEPWGWQIDGHHLVINCFILGDQMVMTPYFMGSEPTLIEEGPNKGLRTFEAEEDKAIKFYLSLGDDKKNKATLLEEKQYNFIQAEAFKDNVTIPYRGIKVAELDAVQYDLFEKLVQEYVGNIKAGHAEVKMEDIRKHIDETYFCWVGGQKSTDAFYYRIQSPVILIEFDNQGPTFLWDRTKSLYPGPGKKHTHTLVRTPNGNDYGKELLKQHLESHHHDQ